MANWFPTRREIYGTGLAPAGCIQTSLLSRDTRSICPSPGGIYLDLDSLVLRSMDALRRHDAVQGAPFWYALNNGVLIGAPHNLFHWLFYLSYHRYVCVYHAGVDGANWRSPLSAMSAHLLHQESTPIDYLRQATCSTLGVLLKF